MTDRPPGIKKIKRGYVSARRVYVELNQLLDDLQRAAAYLPDGVLAPAIDLMYDRRDAALLEYRKWYNLCTGRGIRSALGHRIHANFLPDADESDEDYEQTETPGFLDYE